MTCTSASRLELYLEWRSPLVRVDLHRRRLLLPLLVLAWLLTAAIPALALEPIVVNDHVSDLSIGRKNLELMLDPDDRLRLNDFLQPDAPAFTPLQQDVLNLGHSDDSVWLHLQLQPDADTQSNLIWLLQLQFPLLDRVDIYPVRNGKADTPFHIGYSIPMADRPFKHRFFVQPLQVEPGQRLDVYVNIMREGGAVQAPLRLSTPTAFFFAETSSNHAMGIYFGIMIAMIIYNFFLLFSVGNRSYFYYIVYICFTILTIQTFTGYGYLFLWPDQPWMNQYVTQIVSVMAVITGTLFTRNFVKFERYSNWMIPFTNAGIGLGVLLILARIFSNNFLSLEIVAYCSLMLFSAPIIVFMCWRRGSRQAGFFLLAWGLFLAGALMFTATLLGLLPSNTFTTNGMMLGSAAEVLMLSLGLADRINRERKEKYQMLQEQNKTMLRLKEAEDRLIHRALHNRTTGLPNRNFLRNTLDNLITAEQDNFQFSLLLVSLNNFHEFNKTLGHSNGDAILRIITERLSLLSRDMPGALAIERSQDRNHFVAGVEGVTFAMLLQGSSSQELLEPVHKFLHNLEKPFEYHNLTLDVDATCGLAHYPDHGTTSENLMRNAHIALEAASGNKQKLALYSPEIDPYNARRLSLLGELRHAIEQDALQLYFQPQISLRDFSVAGAEVLIRWIHPEYGFIPPDEFIPLAERTGVIHPLTYWICKHAFAFKHDLEMQGIDIHLSINISARNLQDPHFVREVARLADEAGISLKRIIMELTETAVMTDPEDALRVMTELNGQGIRLSIDDFGTGYSSLSYLKQLPVDEIKIDRSFVMEMAKNNDDQVIVHTTLTMGHNLSMEVVAEGIEDATTLRKLKDMGCDLAQGYHIAKPMPAADFFTWLSKYQASLENDAASKDVRRQG